MATDKKQIFLPSRKLSGNVAIDRSLEEKFSQAQDDKHSIEDFFREFLGGFLSPHTQRAYLKDLGFFFEFLAKGNFQPKHPNEIKAIHFSLYRDHMLKIKLSPATINRRLTSIRSFIKWAMATKLIDHNPLDAVKLPKVQTLSPTNALTDEEAIRMIDAPDSSTFKGQSHRLILILLFNLGLRRSELINIKCQDLFEERHHYVLKVKGKGDKLRLVPITSAIKKEIQDYLEKFFEKNKFCLENKDFLFPSNHTSPEAKPIDGSTVYRIVKRYAKKVGIDKDIGAHSCRATVISHLLDTKHLPIRDVAHFAGHSNINTTEKYDKKRKGIEENAAYQVELNSLSKKS